jgi:Flp pilus assembly pilin Flp
MQKNSLRALLREQSGLSTVEYTVLLVLIVALSVGMWHQFGNNVLKKLKGADTDFTTKVTSTADG